MELLNQMDGFDQTVNVKVIMATNRADTLDPALLRPGRLDRKIEFPLPDRRQKRLVFQVSPAVGTQLMHLLPLQVMLAGQVSCLQHLGQAPVGDLIASSKLLSFDGTTAADQKLVGLFSLVAISRIYFD